MNRSERFQRAGFTLLEVMAAVAILGIVYVAMARSAIQGLQIEGDASRRLRASLRADRVVNDMELELLGGSAPRVGETETTEEEFTVLVEVSPFEFAGLLEGATGQGEVGARSTPALELLKPPVRGGVPALLSIAVRVAWIEGISEQEVTRNSFAFDLEAAAPLLETIQPAETTGEGEDQRTPAGRRQPGTTAREAQ
jgi:prepilin-type N-terminal cleavage/methylation domain-containing protein